MTNNDILRRLRYCFDLSDKTMIAIFAQADSQVTREQVSNWLKKEDDVDYQSCNDRLMATFLNGFINYKRGRREGDQPKPESQLSNNLILKKLNIALNLRSDDVLAILELAGFRLSKHELSAFFRKPGNKHYRECKDQVLRNYLQGLQLKYRAQPQQTELAPTEPKRATFTWKKPPSQ